MGNKYKSLLKDTSIFALGSLGSKLILFFLVPLYTNFLSTEQYGTADLVLTICQLLVPMATLVIFDAVIRFGLMKKDKKPDVLLVALIMWGIGIAIVLLSNIGLMFYGAVSKYLLFIDLYTITNMLYCILLNYLKAKDKNIQYSLTCIIETIVLAVSNIICLVALHMGIEGFLLSYLISQVVAVICAILFGTLWKDIKLAHFDKKLAKEMVKYSAPLVLNNLSWWIIQSSDKVMIESMVGADGLGIYTVAAKIPSLISVFVTIFQSAWSLNSIKEIETEKDIKFFKNIFEWLTFIVIGACLALTIIIKPFMSIYASGKGYENAWSLTPLLIGSAVFSAVAAYYGSLYGALKKSINNMVSTLIAAVLNIILNLILIKPLGVYGACIATMASYFVLAIVRMIDVNRYIKIKFNIILFIINAGLAIACAILATYGPNIYVTSAICLGVFLLVNIKTILSFIKGVRELIKNKSNKEAK